MQQDLINALTADQQANGTAKQVLLGIVITTPDGTRRRIDGLLADGGSTSIFRDPNYPEGRLCLAADMAGVNTVFEGNPCEVMADIAFHAGFAAAQGKISVGDSRTLNQEIVAWAVAFEDAFHGPTHGDRYHDLLDAYATYRLAGNHGDAINLINGMREGKRKALEGERHADCA